jgi:hypothetical protein
MKESQINPKDFTKTIGAYSHGLQSRNRSYCREREKS